MKIASLGSGSKGNATLIEDGETCVLIDLGFTVREAERRLQRLGRRPEDIAAILVTHEHGDHISGVAPFARKYKTPVYMTPGTWDQKKMGQLPVLNPVNCHRSFRIQSLGIEPVAVPHDAREPCQYIISAAGRKVGVLTDLGHITPHVQLQYQACDALLLECNHDVRMLAEGPYPWSLKQRVGGQHGHLNNEQAAGLLDHVVLEKLQHLVISHISEKNNAPALAVGAVGVPLQSAGQRWRGQMLVSEQDRGFGWLELN